MREVRRRKKKKKKKRRMQLDRFSVPSLAQIASPSAVFADPTKTCAKQRWSLQDFFQIDEERKEGRRGKKTVETFCARYLHLGKGAGRCCKKAGVQLGRSAAERRSRSIPSTKHLHAKTSTKMHMQTNAPPFFKTVPGAMGNLCSGEEDRKEGYEQVCLGYHLFACDHLDSCLINFYVFACSLQHFSSQQVDLLSSTFSSTELMAAICQRDITRVTTGLEKHFYKGSKHFPRRFSHIHLCTPRKLNNMLENAAEQTSSNDDKAKTVAKVLNTYETSAAKASTGFTYPLGTIVHTHDTRP